MLTAEPETVTIYLCSAQTMQVEQFEEEVEGQLTSLSDLAKLCNQDKIKKVIACGMDYISWAILESKTINFI